ncbi:MAG TPA: polymer-forming cytoskeletal protein [Terriglobia bacterium]|nr:polymer-forming cytoskeletal protein [Terriglobia bacterium]
MDLVAGAFTMDGTAMSMWREKKTRSAEPLKVEHAAPPSPPRQETTMNEMTARSPSPTSTGARQTVLGQTVVLKGELTADEDLLIEGQFEGTLSLEQHCLTVGANGQVKAEIHARQAVILGTLTGKVVAREKVEIRRSGHLVGDLATGAVAIEEGAYFKGSIEILREEAQQVSRSASLQRPSEADD